MNSSPNHSVGYKFHFYIHTHSIFQVESLLTEDVISKV